ncbi:MAG TPA: phosphatase PAP2 family protein [Albitalea sp.]
MTQPNFGRSAAPTLSALCLALCAGLASAQGADDRARHAREAPAWCGERCDAVVTDWSLTAHQAITAADGNMNPLAASRALAMMHLAMHDAANAARPRFARYTALATNRQADAAVAAAAAAHDVMAALYPQQVTALLKPALDRTMLEAGGGASVTAGITLGKAAAQAVLAKRVDDGSNGTIDYAPGTRPGEYRFTPGFDFIFAPHWQSVTPFALTSASQFRVAAPPALASDTYRRDYDEVKRVGGKTGQRSADETHYAAFWYEPSNVGWNRVARAVSASYRQDLWQRARSFALLNVAMADAYIAGWDSKMHHNFWRPVTAIRLGDHDGNPRTLGDAAFESMLPTPPIQDMPSTHSALGAAAATVLAETHGRDTLRFSFASSTAMPGNPVRSFRSLSEAAIENADSRVRAGLHFRFSTQAGLLLGRQIGRHAVDHLLKPVGGGHADH